MSTDNEQNRPSKPNLILIPARRADEPSESYLVTDRIWFQKVRHLADLWEGQNFGGQGPDDLETK